MNNVETTEQSHRPRERMNLVVVGHVDHGKSTLIGRILADSGSLPAGKLEQVRESCARTARPFEYAFLLDALSNEQSQGITIDTARCFFRWKERDYIIIDAPGHREFLKNMVSGAARAESALLVIDAKEGVRENSRRHGYMLSMLGIRQVIVVVNKMDLVGYDERVYTRIVDEYSAFLAEIGVFPLACIPVSALGGENLIRASGSFSWYSGPPLLDLMAKLRRERSLEEQPFRFPVQDVYKFTELGDERRIIAGRVEAGSASVGDEVVLLPSEKRARITSIEEFNGSGRSMVEAGRSIGLVVEPEIYVRPGEIMVRRGQAHPSVADAVRVNLFWMGRRAMIPGKKYKLKIATAESTVWLREIRSVLDASDLSSVRGKQQIDQYDVADCTLETAAPIAFDRISEIAPTGRFVIVDEHEISGGGIILEAIDSRESLVDAHIRLRSRSWDRTSITPGMRAGRYLQPSTFVVITGPADGSLAPLAKRLEERLFDRGQFVYYLGLSNALLGVHSDDAVGAERPELIRHLGEYAHLFTDAGSILITTVAALEMRELDILAALTRPSALVLIHAGGESLQGMSADLTLPEGSGAEEGARAVERLLFAGDPVAEAGL